MSRNGRGTKTRRDFDFYPTPGWMVDHLLDRLPIWPQGDREYFTAPVRPARILEPCVGAGNIVNTIRRRIPETQFWTWDIDARHQPERVCDARYTREWQFRDEHRPDWVISNPPFSDAFEIIRNAVEVARVGVAMLLRCTWVEPTKTGPKAAWLAEHPPKWRLTMERWSFDGASQDSATTEWLVWSPFLDFKNEIIVGRGNQPDLFGESSSGRTADFGSADVGSTPALPAIPGGLG